ncbi:MAG: OmpA family protein, partial [Steroidobacteraceae bacterium]
MTARAPPSPLGSSRGRLIGFTMLLLAWHAAAWAATTDTQDCRRLVGGTLACRQESAGDAPPNTERADPNAPPSAAMIKRLTAAAATLPAQPPATTLQLIDTSQRANFASGSDEFTPAAMAKLASFAAAIRDSHPQRVLVTAHTDSQRLVRAARGRFKTNQGLSEARAARVAQYLQAALGLPQDAFAIEGFGASRP